MQRHHTDDAHEHEAHGEHRGHDARSDHGGGQADHGDHGDHADHAAHHAEAFRRLFWIALVLSVPVVIWSDHIQDLLGYAAPTFPGSAWIPAVLGTIVFAYCGRIFLTGAVQELRDRLPGMMTLIAMATLVAFLFSWIVELGVLDATALWWELATLVTIMLAGHWVEMRSISGAQGALKELARLLPDQATRIGEDGEERVPTSELREGDLILVRPGERIPADGHVRKGDSSVDESAVTGESRPVRRGEGDEVTAGTVNGDGSLRIEVAAVGDGTRLAGVMRLVEDAQASRSRAQALADRAARALTYVALAAAAVTFTAWILTDAEPSVAVIRTVTVLVIACPHALGLAIPLVVAISTTLGARAGLLVRDRLGLEEARRVDTVVFDKTGTLTLGSHRVTRVVTDGSSAGSSDGSTDGRTEEDEALRLAAAAEADAEHPIARGIVASAEERNLDRPSASGFRSLPGKGVTADVEGETIWVGGPSLLAHLEVEPSQALRDAADAAADEGRASVYLVRGDAVRALFVVADAVREESAEAIAGLHDRGVRTLMLTGDARAVADAVARELGIDEVRAEVPPEAKADVIAELQREGRVVAMVGDGVNDAPALARADVGIAIGAGTDVAVEAGHVVLVRSDPRDVVRVIDLSRATWRKMVQNLVWAAGYNVVAIPLAAGVAAPWGVVLSPAVGAVLMSLSTVIVAVNAQLLRRWSASDG